ncbi:hypothetical protein [Pseudomonas baetica]|uniref:hypothetical protein n=1 Tax=Pseudomonas baetica TaxID=674054 RepID=UPI002405D681|nr:hypothetical protein [Pseudomonas baetica]MDF9779004.1 hypothetical protein [Pseudomonas baetica]
MKSAASEVATATKAHAYYQVQPLTKGDRAFYWLFGFTQGVSCAMAELRQADKNRPAFDPGAEIEMSFQASNEKRPVLIVDVVLADEHGTKFPVTSTLNYVEAQTVLTGLNILRGTGIYCLKDFQADNFITQASSMLAPGTKRKTASN